MARDGQVVGFVQHDDGSQTYTIGGQSRVFRPDDMPLEMQTQAMRQGFKTRISNMAALSRDPKTGRSATPEEKRASVWKLLDWYEGEAPTWELPRTGGGGGRSEASYILEAVANVQGIEIEAARTRAEEMAEKRGMTVDGYLRKLAAQSQDVREEVARIKYGEAEGADDMLDDWTRGGE